MNTFSVTDYGYGYIDESNNYCYVVCNDDCNAPDEEYLIHLTPVMAFTDECPFWLFPPLTGGYFLYEIDGQSYVSSTTHCIHTDTNSYQDLHLILPLTRGLFPVCY